MKFTISSVLIGLAAIIGGQLAAAGNCDYGPDTCIQGYVWREAIPSDHVCVPPSTRSQTRTDNSLASSRRSPTGGPYGPDTCLSGYVWREAYGASDHVCVLPSVRAQARADNAVATSRISCGQSDTKSWEECTQEWYGTAPFCEGGPWCPDGQRFIRSASSPGPCEASTEKKVVFCIGADGASCWSGSKILCERDCITVTQQG